MKTYMRIIGALVIAASAGILALNGYQIMTGAYNGGPLVPGFDPTSSGQVVVPVFTLIGLLLILDYGIDAVRFGWKKARGGRLIANSVTTFCLVAMFQALGYIYGGEYLFSGPVFARYALPALYLAGAILCCAQKEQLIINPTAAKGAGGGAARPGHTSGTFGRTGAGTSKTAGGDAEKPRQADRGKTGRQTEKPKAPGGFETGAGASMAASADVSANPVPTATANASTEVFAGDTDDFGDGGETGVFAGDTGVFEDGETGVFASDTETFDSGETGIFEGETGTLADGGETGALAGDTGVFEDAETGAFSGDTGVFAENE